jgi:integrase/recombinase XerD
MHSSENPQNPIIKNENQLVLQQADSDEHLIELWLHGRSHHTQRAYRKDIQTFIASISKPLNRITLGDLQNFASTIMASELQPASIHRALSAIKSLFAFGHRLGYLQYDVAKPLILPPIRDKLSERILDESEVKKMIAIENMPRNKMILLTLYATGFRVSELCSLKWKDIQARDNGSAQITVFGKGGKTRTVLIPKSVWSQLLLIRNDASEQSPIFRSQKGGHVSECQAWRIVSRAAKRAGIPKAVSCHWLRHANASHSLDKNAPIHLVQATLGHSSIATTGRYLHASPKDSTANYLDLG